jgi:tetratricopeptide (TPR) repeat protein
MRIVIAFTLLMVAASAQARGSRVQEARGHFEEAQKLYAVGEFEHAGEEYQLAYRAKPDPALLYNAAQSFRLANQPSRAILLYKNYLQFYPGEANAEDVRGQIAKLKEAIAAADRAKSSPPTGVETPKPLEADKPASVVTHSAPLGEEPEPRAIPVEEPAKPASTPVYKKWWLWTVVGAGALALVVGVGVGVGVGTQQNVQPGPVVGPGSRTSSLSSQTPMVEVRW